jgi:hypothetical protein
MALSLWSKFTNHMRGSVHNSDKLMNCRTGLELSPLLLEKKGYLLSISCKLLLLLLLLLCFFFCNFNFDK